mgnify:CR=1 FL=1
MAFTNEYRYGVKYNISSGSTGAEVLSRSLSGLNTGGAGGSDSIGPDANVAVPYLVRTLQNFSSGEITNARYTMERSLTF